MPTASSPASSPVSLPLLELCEQDLTPPPSSPIRRSYRVLAPDSPVRESALKIVAMRAMGMDDDAIGEVLGVKRQTVQNYLCLAGSQGWLDGLPDPKDRIKYDLMHKVLRNIDETLDADDPVRRGDYALKVAEGTIFKEFGEQQTQQFSPSTLVAIKIEYPPGEPQTIRAETIGGRPAYGAIDVESKSPGSE